MALTELEIKKAKATDKPQKLADGGGMYLFIHPNGGKYWRMDYRHAEKRKTLALGIYPTVSLLDARARREEARRLLANGSDPAVIKQAAKVAVIEQAAIVANSFKLLAIEFHTMKKPSWTEGHAKQWLLNLERYAFPSIGEKPITAIKPMEIMAIMRAMEERGTFETRDRLLQTIAAVFKYAMATGRADGNPADIKIALATRSKENHFKCVSPEELPAFLRALTEYEQLARVSPIAITAARLLMLTAVRTSEVRFSKWQDFDLDNACWIVPEEQQGRKGKQGNRRAHSVPLSTQAVQLMRNLYPITGSGVYAFPNRNKHGKVISENTVLKIIEIIGYKGKMTGHGFRSLARSSLGEKGHRWEVLEAMLSHAIGNQTAAAYVRTTYFEERKALMQEYADYLHRVEQGAEIIPLKKVA